MKKHIIYISLIVTISLIGSCFFFKSDKSYLQNKTIKLLELISSSFISRSETNIFRRIHEIAKHMHFSVEYEVNLGSDGLHKDRSLNELRSLLFIYFKKSSTWNIETPAKEDFNITVSKSEVKKIAEVSFPIKATKEDKKISCRALLHWIKDKKWLIHKIKVFSCTIQQ